MAATVGRAREGHRGHGGGGEETEPSTCICWGDAKALEDMASTETRTVAFRMQESETESVGMTHSSPPVACSRRAPSGPPARYALDSHVLWLSAAAGEKSRTTVAAREQERTPPRAGAYRTTHNDVNRNGVWLRDWNTSPRDIPAVERQRDNVPGICGVYGTPPSSDEPTVGRDDVVSIHRAAAMPANECGRAARGGAQRVDAQREPKRRSPLVNITLCLDGDDDDDDDHDDDSDDDGDDGDAVPWEANEKAPQGRTKPGVDLASAHWLDRWLALPVSAQLRTSRRLDLGYDGEEILAPPSPFRSPFGSPPQSPMPHEEEHVSSSSSSSSSGSSWSSVSPRRYRTDVLPWMNNPDDFELDLSSDALDNHVVAAAPPSDAHAPSHANVFAAAASGTLVASPSSALMRLNPLESIDDDGFEPRTWGRRRRSSISRVARRWGCSYEDALEMCVNVELQQDGSKLAAALDLKLDSREP